MSRIWEIKERKYTKTLAKIQVGAIFHMRDIRRNVLSKFIELYGDTMLVPLNMIAENQQKTSVTEFCYECVKN